MKKLLFSIGALVLIGSGCTQDNYQSSDTAVLPRPVIPVIAQPTQKDLREKFAYQGDRYRDPFIPLTGEGMSMAASDEVVVPNIGTLALKGLFKDGKVKMALISGSGTSYVLKGSMLYDNRQRLVKGISGVVKPESVLLIAPDKTTKELFLREKQ